LIPDALLPGEKPLVVVTHDESTFNANEEMQQLWMFNVKPSLRPKSTGKGIIVSGFFKPCGVLKVSTAVLDTELLKDPM
jgi:hypothetical protein